MRYRPFRESLQRAGPTGTSATKAGRKCEPHTLNNPPSSITARKTLYFAHFVPSTVWRRDHRYPSSGVRHALFVVASRSISAECSGGYFALSRLRTHQPRLGGRSPGETSPSSRHAIPHASNAAGRPLMTHSSDQDAFRYSRIYAEGWKAARLLLKAGADTADVRALNPYHSGLERTKWNEGFAEASNK